jgi:hypothetical protein
MLLSNTVYVFVGQEYIQNFNDAIIIDNFGHNLLPEQILERIKFYDTISGSIEKPIVLQTINPIVMNQVDYEYIYIKKDDRWKSVIEVHSYDWLRHFRPGDLFERNHLC